MASERQLAKTNATQPERSDPEFAAAQNEALMFRLETLKQQNSHIQTMHKTSIGKIGDYIGDSTGAPNAIAVIIAIVALMIAVGCYAAGIWFPTNTEFWGSHAEKAIATAMAAAAYLFGRNASK
jgi:hypothetical protein